MMCTVGNKKVFRSTHPIDRDTSITLVSNELLLLEDTNMVASTLLDDGLRVALVSALRARLYIRVLDDEVEEILHPLIVKRGDRGNGPTYCSGVVLSLTLSTLPTVSVFIDENEVYRLIKAL